MWPHESNQILNSGPIVLQFVLFIITAIRVLLYGLLGMGKTLLQVSKAPVTTCPLNMYVCESEANVRRVFRRLHDGCRCVVLRRAGPCAPEPDAPGDPGHAIDSVRIVSQQFAKLDGISSSLFFFF